MKDNVISLSDYTNLNGFEKSLLTSQVIEKQIVDNFEKGKITEEIFLGGINTLDKIEKGKRGVLGEIRTWSGKKYQKTASGWTPVKEGYSEKNHKEVVSAASAEQVLRARRVMDSDESTPEQKAKAKEFLDNKKSENDKSKNGNGKKEGLLSGISSKIDKLLSEPKPGDTHKGEKTSGTVEKKKLLQGMGGGLGRGESMVTKPDSERATGGNKKLKTSVAERLFKDNYSDLEDSDTKESVAKLIKFSPPDKTGEREVVIGGMGIGLFINKEGKFREESHYSKGK